jgi:hypothetical protein
VLACRDPDNIHQFELIFDGLTALRTTDHARLAPTPPGLPHWPKLWKPLWTSFRVGSWLRGDDKEVTDGYFEA